MRTRKDEVRGTGLFCAVASSRNANCEIWVSSVEETGRKIRNQNCQEGARKLVAKEGLSGR